MLFFCSCEKIESAHSLISPIFDAWVPVSNHNQFVEVIMIIIFIMHAEVPTCIPAVQVVLLLH